jgi:hypothetical protein
MTRNKLARAALAVARAVVQLSRLPGRARRPRPAPVETPPADDTRDREAAPGEAYARPAMPAGDTAAGGVCPGSDRPHPGSSHPAARVTVAGWSDAPARVTAGAMPGHGGRMSSEPIDLGVIGGMSGESLDLGVIPLSRKVIDFDDFPQLDTTAYPHYAQGSTAQRRTLAHAAPHREDHRR